MYCLYFMQHVPLFLLKNLLGILVLKSSNKRFDQIFGKSKSLLPVILASQRYQIIRKPFHLHDAIHFPQPSRSAGILLAEKFCPWDSGEVETSGPILLHCSFYTDVRAKFIFPIISNLTILTPFIFSGYLKTNRSQSQHKQLDSAQQH